MTSHLGCQSVARLARCLWTHSEVSSPTLPPHPRFHPFAVVTRHHQWICRSHSANPPSYLSHLCQGWIWSAVTDVMQKNIEIVDKTTFSGPIIHGAFELQQWNSMEGLASVALTTTLHLWHFYELLKHDAVARELPTKAALSFCVWMTVLQSHQPCPFRFYLLHF